MTYDTIEVPIKDSNGNWQFDNWLEGMLPIYNGGTIKEFNPPILRVPIDFDVLGVDVSSAPSTEAQNSYTTFLSQFKEFITTQNIIDLSTAKWMIWIGELDEPYSKEMSALILLYYDLTQNVNDASFAFDFEIDGTIDWDSPAIQHTFTEDISSWDRVTNSFDIWLAPQEDFEFDLPYIEDRVSSGQDVLIYQQAWSAFPKGDIDIPPSAEDRDYEFPSLPGIANPALFHRILPWFAWKYEASGIGFWAVMYWYNGVDNKALDVWIDDPALWIFFRTVDHIQSGDGWLVYPGDKINEHTGQPDITGPVSSIRLELFRKGLEDYKYLKLLKDNQNSFDSETKIKAQNLMDDINKEIRTITDFNRDAKAYDILISNIKQILIGQELINSVNNSPDSATWWFDIQIFAFVFATSLLLRKRKSNKN